jgi:predicted nucleic acid-binding protein
LIFLDTGFLYALFAEEDEHHLRVREALERYRGQSLPDFVLTTNYVAAETIALARAKGHPDSGVRHDRAVDIGRRLWAGHFGEIHRVTEAEEREALDFFTKHRDKRYSFVDCVSFVVMEKLGIREAFTVDSDFTHHFVAIPGPSPR